MHVRADGSALPSKYCRDARMQRLQAQDCRAQTSKNPMDERDVRKFLTEVRSGKLGLEAAVERLRGLPYEDAGFAKIDHHRALRQGYPEVIFGRGKTPKQVTEIARRMLRAKASHNILITRADKKTLASVKKIARAAEFHALSGAIVIRRSRAVHGKGLILIVPAGTTDIPVAEEA